MQGSGGFDIEPVCSSMPLVETIYLISCSWRRISVDVRVLFPPPADRAGEVPDGLVVDDVVPGALEDWLRTTSGDWIGVVTLLLKRRDGSNYRAHAQLIPAQALRPR